MSLDGGAAQAPGAESKGAGASEELFKELKELLKEMEEIADGGNLALKGIQRIQRLLEDVEDVLNEITATAEVAARYLRENYFQKQHAQATQ
jgi:ElaB/YqjD/DUF883 family membrane-anchored ribosome-binding protein